MNELQTRPLADLAVEANRLHAEAQATAATAVELAQQCGEKLAAAKAQLNHGEWLTWLEANFQGTPRTAQSYLKLASNAKRVSHLPKDQRPVSIRQALRELAGPPDRSERPSLDPAPPVHEAHGPRAFQLVYADPPWRYEHVKTESRAIENQYPTMSLDEICAMKVGEICADDAVLFMWTTSPKLAESLSVVDAWGFTYRTCAVWVKDRIGMGYYFRQRHELLLVATRGQPGAPEESARADSVIEAPRLRHSAKPLHVYELIERMYPRHSKIELFARVRRDGWHAWGNQAEAAA